MDRPLDEYGWEQWKGWCGREDPPHHPFPPPPPPFKPMQGSNNACRLSLKTLRARISIFSDNWGSDQLQPWLRCCYCCGGEILFVLVFFSYFSLSFSLPLPPSLFFSPHPLVNKTLSTGWLAAFLNTAVAPMPRLMFRSCLEISLRHWWRFDGGLVQPQISEWVSSSTLSFLRVTCWICPSCCTPTSWTLSNFHQYCLSLAFCSVIIATFEQQVYLLKCKNRYL